MHDCRGGFHQPSKVLREAFLKALAAAELLARAEQINLEIEPSRGAELEALAMELVSQMPEIIGRMKKLLGK